MRRNDKEATAHELVIVRRRNDGEGEGHHSGAWKIAFADFMTALMTFFLVMWLINSTDKKTLTQIATYFNPLKLTDKVTRTKGIRDLETGAEQSNETKGKVESAPGSKNPIDRADEKAKGKEEVLFKDPFGVLSKLAAEAQDELKKEKEKKNPTDVVNEQRRPAPYDPFLADPGPIPKDASLAVALGSDNLNGMAGDVLQSAHGDGDPSNRFQDSGRPDALKATTLASSATSTTQMSIGGDTNASKAEMERVKKDSPEQARIPPTSSEQKTYELYKEGDKEKQDQDLQNMDKTPTKPEKNEYEGKASDTTTIKMTAANLKAEAAQVKTEIEKSLKDLPNDFKPNIEIKATPDGLLISLTDDLKFSMFTIASAVPNPRLVAVMDRISDIVTKHPGKIVVYGHTDGRPYKAGGNGNWRLSTDRAHMAYFMLVRGKVNEDRFLRVEGYADRKLRVASNPLAAENRRIEILVMREVK